jgi:peptide/nickel transport system permease protein
VDSIYDRDYPTIQGFVVFTGTVFVLLNLLVDLAYVWLDPRVRLTGAGEGEGNGG